MRPTDVHVRSELGKPPAGSISYKEFVSRYPKLGRAWEHIADAGAEGPLDLRVARLVKLGISIGSMREEDIRSCVLKALDAGISSSEIDQVVALSAGNLGLQASATAFGWVDQAMEAAGGTVPRRAPRPMGMHQSRPAESDGPREDDAG